MGSTIFFSKPATNKSTVSVSIVYIEQLGYTLEIFFLKMLNVNFDPLPNLCVLNVQNPFIYIVVSCVENHIFGRSGHHF